MSRTRTVALLLLAAGCGKPDAPAPSPAAARPAAPTPPPAAAVTPAPKPAAAAPAVTLAPTEVEQANAVAKRLIDGVVGGGAPDPAALGPKFRTALAGGDAARADWAAEQYLRTLAGGLTTTVTASGAGPGVVGFTAPAGDGRRAAFLMSKTSAGWQIDWLHVGPAGPVVGLAGPAPDLAQRFAVAAFLETALTGQHRLAEAALTPAARSRVAPPLGNDPLGFSRGTLTNKLKGFAGGATGYALTLTGTQAAGELLGPGDLKRPFKLALADTPDGPKVDDFDPR